MPTAEILASPSPSPPASKTLDKERRRRERDDDDEEDSSHEQSSLSSIGDDSPSMDSASDHHLRSLRADALYLCHIKNEHGLWIGLLAGRDITRYLGVLLSNGTFSCTPAGAGAITSVHFLSQQFQTIESGAYIGSFLPLDPKEFATANRRVDELMDKFLDEDEAETRREEKRALDRDRQDVLGDEDDDGQGEEEEEGDDVGFGGFFSDKRTIVLNKNKSGSSLAPSSSKRPLNGNGKKKNMRRKTIIVEDDDDATVTRITETTSSTKHSRRSGPTAYSNYSADFETIAEHIDDDDCAIIRALADAAEY